MPRDKRRDYLDEPEGADCTVIPAEWLKRVNRSASRRALESLRMIYADGYRQEEHPALPPLRGPAAIWQLLDDFMLIPMDDLDLYQSYPKAKCLIDGLRVLTECMANSGDSLIAESWERLGFEGEQHMRDWIMANHRHRANYWSQD